MINPLTDTVLGVVRAIPAGQTLTYRQVAERAGRPRAWRAVGNILNKVWQTDRGRTIPCHRVIRSDGTPGGYAGGPEKKRSLLITEFNFSTEFNTEKAK